MTFMILQDLIKGFEAQWIVFLNFLLSKSSRVFPNGMGHEFSPII